MRRTTAEWAASAGWDGAARTLEMRNDGLDGSQVLGRASDGAEIRGTPLRLDRHGVVFETLRQGAVLKTSEVLEEFKITAQDRAIYSGRAVVKNVIDAGVAQTCEVTLEDGWVEVETTNGQAGLWRQVFRQFLVHWERFYRVSPEFKVIVADMYTFLTELRVLCEKVEVGLALEAARDRETRERQVADDLSAESLPAMAALFEKFELIAAKIPEEQQPAHQYFIRRQLHPTLLSAPFANRVVRKPLGYAGDYEMVNMILRDPHEGPSLFGKVLNRWFIKQPPAEAHRNRVVYLTQSLTTECLRAMRERRPLRVFNVGCGPAGEIQSFLATSELADQVEFTLLDFNQETLDVCRNVLETARARHRRSTQLHFVKQSVAQLLKSAAKSASSAAPQYDLVYCAGLFDYLQDSVCKQLMSLFADRLAPGGLLIATNVDPSNPIRHWLGYLLEWHLIYRDGRQMMKLRPPQVDPDDARVWGDQTGVNVFLEVRKRLP